MGYEVLSREKMRYIDGNRLAPEEVFENQQSSKPIVFISDLHFDFEWPQHYALNTAFQREDEFIAFVVENFSDSVLCMVGDFYNDFRRTLSFVRRLEECHVVGFFVLGNHDYWSAGDAQTIDDTIALFTAATKDNQFFRFLCTGRKYYINDLCVIGDTAWTSFKRKGGRRVDLAQFSSKEGILPEFLKVQNFNLKDVISLHNEWIRFANKIITSEPRVLMLTHFPMFCQAEKDKDCWWSSETRLKKSNNYWCIYGHTHRYTDQYYNHVSCQRGYMNQSEDELRQRAYDKMLKAQSKLDAYSDILERYGDKGGHLSLLAQMGKLPYFYYDKTLGSHVPSFERQDFLEKNWKAINEGTKERRAIYLAERKWADILPDAQYSLMDFNRLEKLSTNTSLSVVNTWLDIFYSSKVASEETVNTLTAKGIQQRGYRRIASNKINLSTLATEPDSYIDKVKLRAEGLLKNLYAGYVYASRNHPPAHIIEAVFSAIGVIEQGDTSDFRSFMTAAVITGYVFNNCANMLVGMRPLDDFDLMRFMLVFLTMKKFEIKGTDYSIRKCGAKKFEFRDVDIYLPEINGKSLELSDVAILFSNNPKLSNNQG